eukprot:357833-Chlamydomonas_euryale.AAC.9
MDRTAARRTCQRVGAAERDGGDTSGEQDRANGGGSGCCSTARCNSTQQAEGAFRRRLTVRVLGHGRRLVGVRGRGHVVDPSLRCGRAR